MAMLLKGSVFGYNRRLWQFDSQIDSLDVAGARVLCAASNLEGDTWDGSLHVIDLNDPNSSEAAVSATIRAGCSCAKFFGSVKDKVLTTCCLVYSNEHEPGSCSTASNMQYKFTYAVHEISEFDGILTLNSL